MRNEIQAALRNIQPVNGYPFSVRGFSDDISEEPKPYCIAMAESGDDIELRIGLPIIKGSAETRGRFLQAIKTELRNFTLLESGSHWIIKNPNAKVKPDAIEEDSNHRSESGIDDRNSRIADGN